MDAFIVSALRTPTGKFLGGLSELTAPKLGAFVVQELLRDAKFSPHQIDEVIFGNVIQAGLGQNPARQAALGGGLPNTVPAVTINKVCGSGLKAVMLAAQAIRAGDAHLILAGGMESMSNAPHLLSSSRTGMKYGDGKLVDALIQDGLWCAFENWPMGEAAEHTARQYQISREAQDSYSLQSHLRASEAQIKGLFQAEIQSVPVGTGAKKKIISTDEGIRADSTLETLGKLRPAFRADGTVTAGNASQLSDGAAGVVVASGKMVEQLGVRARAKIVAYATSGVAPRDIFIAPVLAVRMVLEKAKLSIDQISLFEINEAFAAQMIACQKDLGIPSEKLNIAGGGIALGHPIGASGARVLVTLLHALETRDERYGIASLCLGGGNAVAMLIDRRA